MGTLVSVERRLRVVHLTPGLDMGGLEKLLVEFARHTDCQRFALRFVSLAGRGVLAEDIEACGWPVAALEAADGFHLGLIPRLSRLLRHWQADVIHTHDDRAHIYGTFAGRLANVPRIIHTRHGRSPQLSRRQKMLVSTASRLIDRFVCVSDDIGRLAVNHGIRSRKICTIRNGIDVQRFSYSGPQPDGPAVIVARLSPEKDIDTLLRAAALVVRDDPAFRLEIAGDGPCMPALRQTSAELGLEANVRFLGQIRDVAGLLARAGLFVLSSLSEGVSLTLLEAMARGLPVVATRVGGNPEVVAEDETGLLVPAQDPAALAAALLRLRRDGGECLRLGQAGRHRVETIFDVRRMVGEYEQLYRGINVLNATAVSF
ncbi:MAG TPA: glycosyltransferase [Gemmataceae bacterium]|nr:glycosyltransferase [Gemmataceae bacterium]